MAHRKQIKKKVSGVKKKDSQPHVLVLGVTGMLGSMVFSYLKKETRFMVTGSAREKALCAKDIFMFDAEHPEKYGALFARLRPTYVINCIGIIKPYCKDSDPAGVLRAIQVNAHFPHILAQYATQYNFRVIQIATDCVYSGRRGQYDETDEHDPLDVYGKTKSLGEVRNTRVLNVRTSIIGPEKKGKVSLLEWFLSQPKNKPVSGFLNHQWNGVTTLQFARLVETIVRNGTKAFDAATYVSPVYHYVPNSAVSKYELLTIFNNVFDAGFKIDPVEAFGGSIDRTLKTRYNVWGTDVVLMKKAIEELAEFMRSNHF